MDINNHILAVVEPAILPTELKMANLAEDKGGDKQTKNIGVFKPFVLINQYQFGPEDIESFRLDMSGIVPKCNIVVSDHKNAFTVESYPRDGDFFTILLNSKHQETFKSVHMDFDIVEIQTDPATEGATTTITMSGVCKIPNLYAEECRHFESASSLDHIEMVARELELGLATNIESTDDTQARIQAFVTQADFIKQIVDESYISDDSFQKHYIDQFYYLNYIDVNKVFNSKNPKIDEVMTVLTSFADTLADDANADVSETDPDNLEVPLVLSNHIDLKGLSCYVESYEIINNSSKISLTAGYSRDIQIYDNNAESEERLQEFRIEPLVTEELGDIEEPLRGNRKDSRYETQVKHKYIGRQNAGEDGLGNQHANLAYSKLHNKQNLLECDKMKLKIQLNSFNPAIYKYQKIPVLMYHYDGVKIEAQFIGNQKRDDAGFSDRPFGAAKSEEGQESPSQMMDQFLSGYYVIENIDYLYDSFSGTGMRQEVTLIRREWPTRIKNLE